jgi:hypothetical protein
MAIQDIKNEDFIQFKSLTKKNLKSLFANWAIFFENDYISIQNFYQGKSSSISSEPFNNFYLLKKECKEILDTFSLFAREFENLKWVELLETVEKINDRLLTLNKINKWSRSTNKLVGYSGAQQKQYTLNQFDNLEKIALNIQKSGSPQNDWYNIAILNHLEEEDYTSEGGKNLLIELNSTNNNFSIISVVDIIDEDSILGKDLDKNVQFDIEAQDLKVLSGVDTINQAILILVTLKKNDNPDFLDHGLQQGLIIGQNRALLNFPVLIRQLTENFNSDDSLKDFSVKNFEYIEDNLYITFEVKNRLDEVQTISQTL